MFNGELLRSFVCVHFGNCVSVLGFKNYMFIYYINLILIQLIQFFEK